VDRRGRETRPAALIFKAILDSDPPPAIRFNREIPPSFEDIISRALENDTDLRFQSAKEMRASEQSMQAAAEFQKISTIAASCGTAGREP
jgi:hypothetical protein